MQLRKEISVAKACKDEIAAVDLAHSLADLISGDKRCRGHEAEPMYNAVLKRKRKRLGNDHAETVMVTQKLAR